VRRTDRQLPLVALGPQCAFRMEAIQKLDQAGIPWRIAAVSPSLSGLWAAATGGLGVTVRTEFGIPGRLVSGRNLFGLPGLGSFSLTLHRRKQNTSAGLERLASIIIGVARACLPLRTDAPAPPSVSRKRRKQ
jgi:DNA-binding transcriptional LysR family regulator